MTNDEKILELLQKQGDRLEAAIAHLEKQGVAIDRLEQGQQEQNTQLSTVETRLTTIEKRTATIETTTAQIKTGIETLDALQQAHRSEMNMRFQDLNAKFGQKLGNHEGKIKRLEEHAGLPDYDKH